MYNNIIFLILLFLIHISFYKYSNSQDISSLSIEDTFQSKHYHHFVFYNQSENDLIKENDYLVPNIVHFVCLDDGDLPLYAFLHILGALANFPGSIVYFHSISEPTGIHWYRLKKMGRIQLMLIPTPIEIFGHVPTYKGHMSDITRIRSLRKYGGIYLDLDVIPFRSFNKFRNFPMTMGKQNYKGPPELCAAVMIASNISKFLDIWYEKYREVDFSNIYFHAVILPGQLSVLYPSEIQVQDRPVFYNFHEDYYFRNVPDAQKFLEDNNYDPFPFAYAQHFWGNLNTQYLVTFNESYYCHSNHGYAFMVRYALRNTNWQEIECIKNKVTKYMPHNWLNDNR